MNIGPINIYSRNSQKISLFLLCIGLALGIYVQTLAQTVYTFDSAEFATGAYTLGIIHATGYPFYLLLARLFTLLPIGDVAYRVNLMSAIWGAVTVGLVFLLCRRLTGRAWLSAAGALAFGFSFYYWREAVIAETYTLNTALITFLILLLSRKPEPERPVDIRMTALTGWVLGLSFANHMSTILTLPALAYWAVVRREHYRPWMRHMVIFALCVLAGLAFYLYLPIRYAADPPLNYAKSYFETDLTQPAGLWSWMTGEMFRAYMGNYDLAALPAEIAHYAGWLWTNYLGAGVIIGAAGWVLMLRRDTARGIFLTLLYLAYTLFFINYRVVNKDTMFAMSYLIWTIWMAYGAAAIGERLLAPYGPRIAAGFLGLLAALALVVNYAWVDQSSHNLTREFTGELLSNAASGAFVLTEWTWATPLEYYQIVEGRRPDLTIFDRGLYGLNLWNRLRRDHVSDPAALDQIEQAVARRIQNELAHRVVYATEYDDGLAQYFDYIPRGHYYELRLLPGR